jgi:phosphoglycolate phosphatase-like HAD superfamily hydrolase
MLRPDQIADLAILMNNPRHMLLSEPGTGKTPTICVYQRWLREQHGTPSVWTMPKSLLEKNRDEAIQFGGWAPEDVVIVDGTQRDVEAQLAKPAGVFLMGFRRFEMEWQKFPREWKAFQADEFHKGFGGHDSLQAQAMYGFMQRQGEWFVPMTGTLLDGKLETAFPAINVIEPRYYGSFESFCHYHRMIDLFTGKKTGYRNHDNLQTVLRKHGIRRLFSDIFGPQDPVMQVEWLSMSEAQREIYDRFQNEAILELEKFYIDGTQPGVAFMRACQIMDHPNRFPDLVDEGQFVDIMPGHRTAKAERLDLHLTDHVETGRPLIIYAPWVPQQHEAFELARQAGLRVGLITGATSSTERGQIDRGFRAGELNCLICSPLVADAGFNWQFCGLQEVPHIIFLSLPYKDTTLQQAIRRAIRQARATALRVTILAYKQSLNIRQMQLIEQKSIEANRVDPTYKVFALLPRDEHRGTSSSL